MSVELDALVPRGRRSLIKVTNIVGVALIGGLTTVKIMVLGLESPPVPPLFAVVVGLANMLYLHRNGSLDVAAWIIVAIAIIGFTGGSLNTGGFSGPAIFVAPIIPLLTMLLIDSRAAWATLALVCLLLTGIFVLGHNGIIPENLRSPDVARFARFVVLTCLCVTTTWVVWRFSSMTRSLLIQLEKLSNTDYLTGALNRRGVESALSLEVGRARRLNTSLSFIMADVDFFKLYNDSNGHQAGDNCLIEIVTVISSCCERSTDSVGRFGGEEFVLILPDTDTEGAQRVAENIRIEVERRHIAYGPNNNDPVSLTLGILTALGPSIESIDQLVKYADEALYQGKNQDRNCIVTKTVAATKTTSIHAHSL
jgi:diguanylate cyclase (GGDEF)-like protein